MTNHISILSFHGVVSATRVLCAAILVRVIAATNMLHQESRALLDPSLKYFSEGGNSLAQVHYDHRFFRMELSYNERHIILQNLIRSYLETMETKGVETWLAHGTLLGWWWNAQIMPWDYDLDVQVSWTTIKWLAENLNSTEHSYPFSDKPKATKPSASSHNRTYLLDINPHYTYAESRGGYNLIDGRWIDVENGMFVDITVLRERASETDPGVWSCKNNHRYKAQDLWPLRDTEFEGVLAKIPYNFENILTEEYSKKSLVKERHQHHLWNADLKQWVLNDHAPAKVAVASQKST